ncbi:MAG: DUF2927 domain-containing protein [Methylococcaceae bacterium]|nr:DUF2927 domain-containing protein [Methylococcaceae bacterium]
MNIKKLFISFLILLLTNNVFAKAMTNHDVIEYFNELAFGSEFGGESKRCSKWATNMKIFVAGKPPAYLDKELDKIIKEINTLISPIKLLRVNSKRESNYIIFFGSGEGYTNIEPKAKAYIDENWGLFWVYSNRNNEIFRGTMYVDIFRTKNKNAQKHLLREELTQSLGIMNDSYKYSDSMFYQKWSHPTSYSAIDKQVIKLLYNPAIKPNMTKSEINKLIASKGLISMTDSERSELSKSNQSKNRKANGEGSKGNQETGYGSNEPEPVKPFKSEGFGSNK